MKVEELTCSKISEIIRYAWEIGIVYFQLYLDEINEEFFEKLPELKPFEKVVSIKVHDRNSFFDRFCDDGVYPCFGFITGGFYFDTINKPDEVPEFIEYGRSRCVTPSQLESVKDDDDEPLQVKGIGI